MIYGAGDSPRPSAGAAGSRIGGLKQTAPQPRAIDTSAEQPICGFILGLPRPPSVNRFTNRLGNQSPVVQRWIRTCDRMIMAMRPKPQGVKGPFNIEITWDADKRGQYDLDNPIKPLLDYLQRIELIENDKLCHHMTVKWGPASMGCIVRVDPWRGA